ncbi:MAG TPA: hypothetical protein VI432_01380 [Candidatus Paceibacterota bacterium]
MQMGEEGKNRIRQHLADAHAFTFDGNTINALQKTKADTMDALPFPICFLDAELDASIKGMTVKVRGILIGDFGVQLLEHRPGLIGSMRKLLPKKMRTSKGPSCFTTAIVEPNDPSRKPFRFWNMNPLVGSFNARVANGGHASDTENEKLVRKVETEVKNFVAAWQNLLFDPEVKMVEVRNSPNARKRIEREHGYFPPIIHQIRISGKLKTYLQKQARLVKGHGDMRMHWVRGHFRHLQSKRFTHKHGQRIWVPPHIRGASGPLIRSEYAVTQKK